MGQLPCRWMLGSLLISSGLAGDLESAAVLESLSGLAVSMLSDSVLSACVAAMHLLWPYIHFLKSALDILSGGTGSAGCRVPASTSAVVVQALSQCPQEASTCVMHSFRCWGHIHVCKYIVV